MESCSSASKCGSGMRVSLLDYVRESQVLELLSHVSNGRNNSQRCWIVHVACHCTSCYMLLRVVRSCYISLHTTANTDAATPLPTLLTQQCWELLLRPFARSFTDQLRQNFPQRQGLYLDERFCCCCFVLFCFPFCLFVFYFIFVFVFFSSFQLLLYCKNFTFVI